jgi:uncharacterized OB-fold protein
VAAIENVRVSEKTRGYTWGPFGKFVIAVQDDAANGYPLVIAPIDGSRPPIRMSNTIDNMDPEMVGFGGAVRLVWAATDTDRPEGKRYRIVYVSDYDYTELRKAFGIE